MPEIDILVKARDEASSTLSNVGSKLDNLTKGAKETAMAFGGIAAAGTALIAKTTLTAARTEELGVVIENLGRVSGYTEEELRLHEDSIKDLGITTQGARTIMSRFMGAQLDLADASKIARAAQDLAVIGMQDSSEAAENLTYAIASMQPRILRQYGLFINLNEVYEKTAEALGKDVQELTEAEKRQGMLNAVLEQAGNFAGTYEAAMTTAGKQLRSFHRYTEEISNEFGENFLPIFAEAIGMATDFAKGILGASDASKQAAANIVLIGTAAAGSMASLAGLMTTIKMLLPMMGFLFGPAGLVVLGVGALTALGVAAAQSNAVFKAQKAALLEVSETQEEYVEGVKELIPQTEKAATGFRGYHHDAMEAARETAALTAEQEWGAHQAERYAQAYAESAKMMAEAEEEVAEAVEETAQAMQEAREQTRLSMASAIIDLSENMEAYKELENTVTTVYANTGDIVDNFNDWREDQEKGLQDRLTTLEEKRQDKIAWVLAGAHARTQAENDEALAYWNQRYDKERDKLIETVNEKIDAREEEKNEDIAKAQTAAAERSRLAEEARQAEMAALKAAQEERVILFALEMLEYKNQLQVPIKGFEDMQVTAQEYFDLMRAGIIELTPEMENNLGIAIQTLDTSMAGAGETSTTTMQDLQTLVQDAAGDVMNLGTTTDTEIDRMRRAHINRLKPGILETKETQDEFSDSIEDSGLATEELRETNFKAQQAMRRQWTQTVNKLAEYTRGLSEAIRLTNKLAGMGGGAGEGGIPPAQAGMTYVPTTMPVIVHKAEAILTAQQAARWRTGQAGGQPITINNYLGGVYGVDGFEAAMDEALRDARRLVA